MASEVTKIRNRNKIFNKENNNTSRPLTWVQNFLSFRVAGTEGTVEFEMIDIVQEGATNREQDVLKHKLFITSWEIMPRHRGENL